MKGKSPPLASPGSSRRFDVLRRSSAVTELDREWALKVEVVKRPFGVTHSSVNLYTQYFPLNFMLQRNVVPKIVLKVSLSPLTFANENWSVFDRSEILALWGNYFIHSPFFFLFTFRKQREVIQHLHIISISTASLREQFDYIPRLRGIMFCTNCNDLLVDWCCALRAEPCRNTERQRRNESALPAH